MKPIIRRCLGLLALLVLAGSSAYGDAWLDVCNKGSVAIKVVVALKPEICFGKFLDVSGWAVIPPGGCKQVYKDNGDPAYIGFGFFSSQHRFTAGHIENVPNFGQFPLGSKVLTRADKQLCVRDNGMGYRMHNDPMPDCASFRYDRNDPGGYFSFASALYFNPIPMECNPVGFNNQVVCSGGDYYLNVRPTGSDTELHASLGSKSGKDQPPAEPGIGDAIMKAVGKAAAEKRQKEEQAQAAGRKNVTVCVPESLLTEWRNPPPGSKMEKFKEHFKNALRIHASDPSQDMTEWWWIDDRVYPTYDPATPLGKVVFSYDPGTCGRTGHRENLAINP